jgi:FkbM family methyltransferase
MYTDNISMTELSRKRLGYFLKIEEFQVALFLVLTKKMDPTHLIDIGANVGFYSLICKKYFPNLQVLSFEPTPSTHEQLRENAELNTFMSTGFSAHQLALSSSTGIVDFSDYGDCSGKNGVLNSSIHGPTATVRTLSVETKRFDDLYGIQNERIMIKIDTEGHELSVLRGAHNLINKNQCMIQIEEGYGEYTTELAAVMSANGYLKIYQFGPDSIYTNATEFLIPDTKLSILNSALNFLIAHRWNKNPSLKEE